MEEEEDEDDDEDADEAPPQKKAPNKRKAGARKGADGAEPKKRKASSGSSGGGSALSAPLQEFLGVERLARAQVRSKLSPLVSLLTPSSDILAWNLETLQRKVTLFACVAPCLCQGFSLGCKHASGASVQC